MEEIDVLKINDDDDDMMTDTDTGPANQLILFYCYNNIKYCSGKYLKLGHLDIF